MPRPLPLALLLVAAALAQSASAQPAAAPQAQPLADNPVLEARLVDIAHELRCLVCQNETIAASNADLAVDLRQQIREQLRAGRSDDEIRAYMVQRYGDFVLYRPPLKASTVALWVGPFVLLVVALGVLWRQLRRRPPAAPLSETERERARALLGETGPR